MVNQEYFKNKNVTVIGLARSGFACAQLLYNLGALVSVSDKKRDSQTLGFSAQLPDSIKQELGRHTRGFIRGRDLIVVSPGVDADSKPLIWAKECGVPVISEIECAGILCPAQIIAITGTNGKTTTTILAGRVLEAAGKKVFVLGNIGTPFSSQVHQMQAGDFVSLEVSSFQLETIRSFKPKIAAILNLTPDHLDRYRDLSEYLSAKARIFMNQDESDYLLLNREDPVLRTLASKAKSRVVYFDSSIEANLNFSAVKTIANILGIEKHLCDEVLQSFQGLPHRLEKVAQLKNREFVNDSKATNPEATAFALKNIAGPVILIAGGKDKGFDFSNFTDLITSRVRSLIVLGQAKDKIREVFNKKIPVSEAPDLKSAVESAFSQSQEGDCILLSPMCASFDMFENYEHRGEVFRQAVRELSAKCDR
ncbi:Mur ligase family protein [Candidatus Omnitrophota bacterium]